MISVVVPAHNEEAYLSGCLAAICRAAEELGSPVEILVVLNRCTDRTEAIAKEFGARTLPDDSRCLATIRNRGVAASTGDIVVTCDADSRIHPSMLRDVVAALDDGAVGGGVPVRFDRESAGIKATCLMFDAYSFLTGLSCGAFWTTRASFDEVGGFDESRPMGEDVDFANRLKRLGKPRGASYRTLRGAPLITSTRKFDHFGDWSFLRMMAFEGLRIRRSLKGVDTEFVDEYFYEFNDNVKPALPSPGQEPPPE